MARIALSIDEAIQYSGGVGRYIRMLVRGLLEVAPEHDYVLVYVDKGIEPDFVDTALVTLCPIPWHPRLLHRVLWPLVGRPFVEHFSGPIDLFHVTSSSYRIPVSGSYIVTLYDLFAELNPQHFKFTGRILRRSLLSQMQSAPLLLAISEAVRQDAINYLHIEPKRITTALLGLQPEFEYLEADSSILNDLGISHNEYFLFAGRVDFRKNVDTLFKAYALYCQHNNTHKLVIVGTHGAQANRIFALLDELDIRDNVIIPGYITTEALKALYEHALAFVYPSRHEGFGLPILEAHYCQTPLITTSVGAIPEVAGKGALFVMDPESESELCSKMERVAKDVGLRQQLVALGVHNLERFDWRSPARAAAQIYADVLQEY